MYRGDRVEEPGTKDGEQNQEHEYLRKDEPQSYQPNLVTVIGNPKEDFQHSRIIVPLKSKDHRIENQ